MSGKQFQFPQSFWDNLESLGPQRSRAKDFVDYLAERVRHKDYRGVHIGQHNRTHMDYQKLLGILEAISLVERTSPRNSLWTPHGDYNDKYLAKLRKIDSEALQEYRDFIEIVKKVPSTDGKTGSGTYNSVKKNWFTDYERMGLIKIGDGSSSIPFRSVTLTQLGNKILNTSSFEEGYTSFSTAIDNLIGEDVLSPLIHILWNNGQEFSKLTLAEYQFIVSDKRSGVDASRKMELIRGYRCLKRRHKLFIESHLSQWTGKQSANPIDYGNWKNQAQQAFKVFNSSQYFRNFMGEYLTLSVHEGDMLAAFRRTSNVRVEYLARHAVSPVKDFEFHHIIPFSMITTRKEHQDIDTWKNLVYIHKSLHSKFPRVGNSYLKLDNDPTWRIGHFLEPQHDFIAVPANQCQISSNPAVIKSVLDHNAKLLSEMS